MSKEYKDLIISIHHTAGPKGKTFFSYKGKWLTPKEYGDIMRRKQFIKDSIKLTGFIILMAIRAWVFLKFGI